MATVNDSPFYLESTKPFPLFYFLSQGGVCVSISFMSSTSIEKHPQAQNKLNVIYLLTPNPFHPHLRSVLDNKAQWTSQEPPWGFTSADINLPPSQESSRQPFRGKRMEL